MAKVERFVFNHYQENTFLVYDDSGACVVIDPGMSDEAENNYLDDFVTSNNLKVNKILLTHTHVDHIAGLEWACSKYGAPVLLHHDAEDILRSSAIYASVMGFEIGDVDHVPLSFVADGETIPFGNSQLEARLVPGHAAGSLVFCLHSDKAVFTGDALFCRSIGRTDLPTGDYETLIQRLRSQVLTLPTEYTVYPGHGPKTTVGDEKLYNPFLQ